MSRRLFLGAAAGAAVSLGAEGQGKLRACIIGDTKNGGYGHSLHLVWGYRDDIEVVALADPDEAGRVKHSEEAKAQRQYADWREMLEKEKPDLVAVGPRWTTNHREYVLAAAEIGAHGLLEKPAATDLSDADEMVAATEKERLAWGIAFNFRVTPVVEYVRRMVMEEGLVGEVIELRGRGKEDHRAGGEDLVVLGVHIFDAMRYFVGDAAWCSSDITVDGRPAAPADVKEATEPLGPIVGDRIHAMFGFGKGITGYFATTRNAHGNGGRWGLDIHGSKGVVTLRMNGSVVAGLLESPAWAPKAGGPLEWEPVPGCPEDTLTPKPAMRYSPIIDDMLVAAREGRRPRVSLHDGRQAQEMVQAVYESYVQGRRVALPLEERMHPLKSWNAQA
ncbi:MAG TPA: Gfo/Idh/MocA family oxidoreductase [Candidatus Bathyarchaeia archaeon]|nr:Gfo/Idh/MocA family oxidoreductase [Candidatus Bathyarchaeia archaeon]